MMRRQSRDRQGTRWIVYGVPGGYLTTRRADEGVSPYRRENVVPLVSFRGDRGPYSDRMTSRVRIAYDWVHRTHEVV